MKTNRTWLVVLLSWVGLLGCSADNARTGASTQLPPGAAVAVFAGGCFWCMEAPFDRLPGVVATTSGFAGGQVPNPSYRQVTAGGTGHLEAVQVTYDPEQIGFAELLTVYWRNVDPLDAGGQFCDRGDSYQSAIFVMNAQERTIAEQSRTALAAQLDRPIATTIRDLDPGTFYPAEEYHQNYYQQNPLRYQYYRSGCGRDKRLTQLWGAAAH